MSPVELTEVRSRHVELIAECVAQGLLAIEGS
jgi:hypothetical protein